MPTFIKIIANSNIYKPGDARYVDGMVISKNFWGDQNTQYGSNSWYRWSTDAKRTYINGREHLGMPPGNQGWTTTNRAWNQAKTWSVPPNTTTPGVYGWELSYGMAPPKNQMITNYTFNYGDPNSPSTYNKPPLTGGGTGGQFSGTSFALDFTFKMNNPATVNYPLTEYVRKNDWNTADNFNSTKMPNGVTEGGIYIAACCTRASRKISNKYYHIDMLIVAKIGKNSANNKWYLYLGATHRPAGYSTAVQPGFLYEWPTPLEIGGKYDIKIRRNRLVNGDNDSKTDNHYYFHIFQHPISYPPAGTLTITGDTVEKKKLTLADQITDLNGITKFPNKIYQWKRGNNVIVGATSTSYTLKKKDVGNVITVTASYTDDIDDEHEVISNPTSQVVAESGETVLNDIRNSISQKALGVIKDISNIHVGKDITTSIRNAGIFSSGNPTKGDKRKIRHAVLKAIFLQNKTKNIKEIKVDTKELDIDISKPKVRVFKPKSVDDAEDITINTDSMASDEGFYVNLTDVGDSVIISIPSKRAQYHKPKQIGGSMKIIVDGIDVNDTRYYTTEVLSGVMTSNIKKDRWEDGDTATYNNALKVVFGGFGGENAVGSSIDSSANRSVANADVAELHAELQPTIEIDDKAHLINIAAKRALTATEFKQMFYARGDDEFSVANVYECPNVGSNILASVWGKSISSFGTNAYIIASPDIRSSPGTLGEIQIEAQGHGLITGTPITITSINTVDSQAFGLFTNITYYIVFIDNDKYSLSLSPTGTPTIHSPNHSNVFPVTFAFLGLLPYNASRIMNYNKLSSRPNDPSGVDLAYGYATDLQRNFYASHEVMGNLEKDLCVKKENWTLCSRISIMDQLHSLAFAAEETDDVCMKISCARKWSEVEDALAESCLAENNIIGLGDHVDLYINVRVTNANPQTNDTIIRIRYPVQMTRGPDDLGNWNVVSRNAASAMLTTGIPYDGPEGGNLQYANAAQTEMDGAFANQERTQAPDTTAPSNLDTVIDPHDTATTTPPVP